MKPGNGSPLTVSFSAVAALGREFLDWGTMTVGSSRSSALIRIGLGLIIWARFAHEQLPFYYEAGWNTIFSLMFYLFTTLMIVGYKTNISTFITGVLTMAFYYYFGLVLEIEPYTHHHTYWLGIATLMCALTPCHKSYSLDRWLSVRQCRREGREPPPESGNLWGLRLIVLQLTLMYFWTAFDKLRVGFLNGDRLEALFMYFYIGSNLSDWAEWSWLFALAAWMVIVVEFILAICLPFKVTRKYVIIPGLCLHLAFYVMLPVFTYSVTIVLLYLAYLDANDVHQVTDELNGLRS